MEAIAKYRYAHLSAQKARLIADLIRGKSIEKAYEMLEFNNKKAAEILNKTLKSAVANAENKFAADVDELFVNQVFVDEGPYAKRFRARARGRANQILKRTCHVTVIVSDKRGV
ncbi:MAG: 50S ribosomal protein L22 [Gammaproteobacteria bacterium RIFCSPHIGHO2_12_FULL_41_15]|nr:MAG: 50S ribosomal protein L22 [Gammaproteobacteria bacterium RIFCSPHIGHO2_12_FULL_41_15]